MLSLIDQSPIKEIREGRVLCLEKSADITEYIKKGSANKSEVKNLKVQLSKS